MTWTCVYTLRSTVKASTLLTIILLLREMTRQHGYTAKSSKDKVQIIVWHEEGNAEWQNSLLLIFFGVESLVAILPMGWLIKIQHFT